MSTSGLGRIYEDGEAIVCQGEVGDSMFVIQEGQAQVLMEKDGREKLLRVAGEGELIGEMAIFEKQVRSATVRALGRARVLTIDKKNFIRRISEDPSIAFRVVQTMSRRVRELSDEVARLKGESAGGAK
jgi:CRP/FNR family cyclic AMP-dependent transcriptional regulator